jgi:hypothetical protein
MTGKLARAKSRHIGLATYLKSLTSELNEYISSGSSSKASWVKEHALEKC